MKKLLISALAFFAVVACSLNGYTEYSLTSTSDFEYETSAFDSDSLYMHYSFYGGSDSYGIGFDGMHSETGGELTGGSCMTMKRDSSLVLKEDNKYPQYTMYATSAARGSNVCAVYYQNDDSEMMPDHDIVFIYGANGTCTPNYIMINNTQQTAYDVLSEESPSKYEPGDYLKLTITGILENEFTGVLEETGTVTYYLADWRGAHDVPDSLLTTWKTVSLSKLGNIDYIDFNLESSKTNVIKTFCYDNFISSVYLKY